MGYETVYIRIQSDLKEWLQDEKTRRNTTMNALIIKYLEDARRRQVRRDAKKNP